MSEQQQYLTGTFFFLSFFKQQLEILPLLGPETG